MKFLLILFLPISAFGQSSISNNIDSLIRSQKDFSGVLLVADNGNKVFYNAYGHRLWQAPATKLEKTDIFELASVTKQFTAMVIMMLKEKGKLNYEDLVEKYLDIPYKNITIRNLLTHTSGLPDYQEIMDQHWDKSKVAGNPDIIEYLNRYKPPSLFQPGTSYQYSNTGYVLLASIAEKASGKDFVKLCQNWIFNPLKMKNTNIRTLEQKAATKNFALGHILVKERNEYVRADSFPSSDYTIWLGNRKGPGRISSTAEDLLKWDQALYTGKLIKQSTLDEAFAPMKLNDGKQSLYGFGWVLRNDPVNGRIVYHTGGNPGYSTEIIRYMDKKKTLIILNNNAHESFGKIVNAVEKFLLQ